MDKGDANTTLEGAGDKSVYFSAPGTPESPSRVDDSIMDNTQDPSFYQDAKSPGEEPMDCDDGPAATTAEPESPDVMSDQDPDPKPVYPLEAEPISSEADEGLENPSLGEKPASPGYEQLSSDELEPENKSNDEKTLFSRSLRGDPKSPLGEPKSPASPGEISEPDEEPEKYAAQTSSEEEGEAEPSGDEALGKDSSIHNTSGLEPISPDSNLSGPDSPIRLKAEEDDDILDLNEGAPAPKSVSLRNKQDRSEAGFLSGKIKNTDKRDSKKDDPHSLSKTSLHDDHGELDYDEEEMEDHVTKDGKGEGKVKEDGEDDEKEEGEFNDKSDEGELSDDGSEEGEIKEPGSPRKPMPRSLCRFYNRGQCTWGDNCRFLHPGINDKGNYSLIDRPLVVGPTLGPPSMRGRVGGPWPPESFERREAEFPPPPPSPPVAESAWERGLRHAKELRKKATKRKETEPDFEEKRFNLRIEEDPENKENDKNSRGARDPYFDQNLDEDYYSHKATEAWHGGQYENFEVRWTRDPEFNDYRGDLRDRMRDRRDRRVPSPVRKFERKRGRDKIERNYPEKPDKMADRPPENYERVPPRGGKEKMAPETPDSVGGKPFRADEWKDPWSRVKSPKTKRSRSRSRGRRRRGSQSSYSSYSSSSYSSRSRSRSSSYSSEFSRSSYSRSSSRSSSGSRSRSRTKAVGLPKGRGPAAPPGGPVRKLPPKQGEAPKSAVMKAGAGGDKKTSKAGGPPAGGGRGPPTVGGASKPLAVKPASQKTTTKAPTKAQGKPQPPPAKTAKLPQIKGPQPLPKMAPNPKEQPKGGPGSKAAPKPGATRPDLAPRPDLEQRGRKRERAPPGLKKRSPSFSSSGSSRSRSRSLNGSRSPPRPARTPPRRSLSVSSISSTGSSSSSSSSGSADSEHLYRDIGNPAKKESRAQRGRGSPRGRGAASRPPREAATGPAGRNYRGGPKEGRAEVSKERLPALDRSSGPARVPGAERRSGKVSEPARGRGRGDRGRTSDRGPPGPGPGRGERGGPRPGDRPPSDRPPSALGRQERAGPRPSARPPPMSDRDRRLPEAPPSKPPIMQQSLPKAKDPMKLAGQKSSIKLTLRADKVNSGERKRPAPEAADSPTPAKKPSAVRQTEPAPKAPVRITLPKKEKLQPTSLSPKKEEKKSPAKVVKTGATGGKKKSMSSRREELLQQLKAVEDAIARKRAKMN